MLQKNQVLCFAFLNFLIWKTFTYRFYEINLKMSVQNQKTVKSAGHAESP